LNRFTWDIIYKCNYRCAYCWWDDRWDAMDKKFPAYPSAERWIAAWERIHGLYGAAEINVLGGEPFIFPSFDRVLIEISKMHDVTVTTNLSMTKEALGGLIRQVDPRRTHIEASFHSRFADAEPFLDKVVMLHEAGFDTRAAFVSYPPSIPEIPRTREAFARRNVGFNLLVFRGDYMGKPYPQSYTPGEREVLAGVLQDETRFDYQVNLKTTLGKPCYSGAVYANVHPDGSAYRCGRVREPIGNLLEEGFRLSPGATPCPIEVCNCQEYVYLAEIYEKRKA
jgi:MoaA/NifB/PqqE/SkfB family radical SAM enzyme